MKNHSFRIKERINGFMYYATIELTASSNSSNELIIEFDDRVDPEWYNAIEFGIKYFHLHYLEVQNTGLVVNVKNLHTMIVDSTPSIIFYATVKCLGELFSYSKEIVRINRETGEFVIAR